MTVLGRPNFFGQTLQATAFGAIADGDPVVLNADGTVSAVSDSGSLISPAGDAMFVLGSSNDTVYRYNLGTPFDITTASYSGDSFSVASQEATPRDVFFKPDGLKMFVVGETGDDVNEYALTSAYDITTASYTQNFSVSAQDTAPRGLAFSPDGLKMFVLGGGGDSIYEYDLSVAWDVSTSVYSQNFSVSSQDGNPADLAFNPDGTKMFVSGLTTDSVYEYTLSSGFDLSTASYSGTSLSISAQDATPWGLAFNSGGTKMFVSGLTNDAVFEYDLSSGFDLSTASYSGNSFSVVSEETNPSGLAFSDAVVTTNLTANGYIGVANGAYADGTTATIQLVGSVDDAQSGLTAGKTYYVQTDGSISTTPDTPKVEAGYAISATELVVKGAYSTVTAPEYTPTPLADAIPQQFQASTGLLDLYLSAGVNASSAANFWSALDLQGAYIINTSPTAYTEIVSVTGSGMLGTIVTGAPNVNDDVFIEVTIDDEVREWRMFTNAGGWRGILTFSPNMGWDRGGGITLAGANFDPTVTTAYSTRDTTTTVGDDIYLSPTILTQGIRFKSNMKVRIKSATAFIATSLQNYHGVLYVID